MPALIHGSAWIWFTLIRFRWHIAFTSGLRGSLDAGRLDPKLLEKYVVAIEVAILEQNHVQ